MYITYCLNTQTFNLLNLNCYRTLKEAKNNLQNDTQNFLLEHKNYSNPLTKINNTTDLKNLSNGFYYKLSNKYANRASVYEKTTSTIRGYIWNTPDIKIQKLFIVGLLEVSNNEQQSHKYEQDNTEMNFSNRTISGKTMQKSAIQIKFMRELQVFLDKRRLSIDG